MKVMKDCMDKTENTIKTIDTCISDLQLDFANLCTNLQIEIEDLKRESLMQKVHIRDSNLLILGIPERKTNPRVTSKKIFKEKLGLDQECVKRDVYKHPLPT